MKKIPIEVAERIAIEHDLDQVVVIARRHTHDDIEHVVTFGKTKEDCLVAARIGQHLQRDVMRWDEEYVVSDDEIAQAVLNKVGDK